MDREMDGCDGWINGWMDVHLLFVDQCLGSKALEPLLNVVSIIITCGASKKKKN